MVVAIVISLLIGLTAGLIWGRWPSVRPVRPSPDDQTDDAVSPSGVASDVGLGSVIRAAADELELGMLVSAADGTVIYRNRAASAMNGTHVGLIVQEHIDRVLEAARRGERIDDLVELHGPPRVALQLVGEPMPNGWAVATVEDVSERTRVNMMRTDFVANISHELKTPVGAIAVLAEALFGENDRQVIDRVAGRMVDESHRAVKAIDDLLELSRIESGPLLEEVVVLDDIVKSAIARGRIVDEAKGITVSQFEGHDQVLVRADGRQLAAAVGNLVENAVKYSDSGGTVQVRTHVNERGIEVMVADQGVGISPRDVDRIFERFYRVDRARSRETGGSGLGLSIVRHVAENHGGEVIVSSEEGEGSTFVLRLPSSLITTDSPTAARRASSTSAPTPIPPRSASRHPRPEIPKPISNEKPREQHQ